MEENGLIRKLSLFSKSMASQTGKQIFTIYVLPSISRSKGSQTIKFGQLLKYNIRNIFLKKSCTKCCGERSLRPFSKKSKLNISLEQQFKVYYSLFL